MMADLAVVIVSWNVRKLVLDALRSLFVDLDASGPNAEVYVVDSASQDGTVDAIAAEFPRVKVIASAENLGFGAANNLALRQMDFGEGGDKSQQPKAVYLLNPDTIPQAGSTRALYDALMADPKCGLVGARLSYGDNSFQHSAFGFPGLRQFWAEFFPTPGRWREGAFNGRYPRALYDGDQPFEVDYVLGATMMLKREVIEQTGLFDEAFFLYCEEIDWAWRIHEAGWTVKCVPTAHVVHLSGQSTGQARPDSFVNLWSSRLRLYKKHYPAWKAFGAKWLVALGMRASMFKGGVMLRSYRDVYKIALKQ
jgi:N-acetylglucosaminyl-diphospho-decaprenol L-rhamnosyltransferase